MIEAADIRGLYAIIPTPAVEGSDRWDATDTVDLDETARVVNQLIADGVDGLITTGTTGECATLLPEEYQAFIDCVIRTVDGRIPLFCGAGSLNTRQTIRMVRQARELGAGGCMVGLPMWQPATLEVAVRFFRDVAEAVPGFPLMVYANSRAFRFNFPPPFWRRLAAEVPAVVAAKYSDLAMYTEALAACKYRINFLPVDGRWYLFARLDPEHATACWSTAASMGPAPVLGLRNAILDADWGRAREIHEEIGATGGGMESVPGGAANFASWNIQLEKVRINAAGYMKAGPVRPPYHAFKDADLAGAQEGGVRWRELQRKYAGSRAAASTA